MRYAYLSIALIALSANSLLADRRDPAIEGTPAQIASVLRHADVVGVFCGEDVSFQTCTFFERALHRALAENNVATILVQYPEPRFFVAQSFFVPPMSIPFTDVTIRLIEDDTQPDHATRLWMGGACFDKHATEILPGFQLPRWVEKEGEAKDTGPMEGDKAAAASKLVQEFIAYWKDEVRQKAAN